MIEEKFISQNEDIDILVNVFEEDGTTPLDMSLALGIYIIIHDGNKRIYAKFTAYNAGGDWQALDATNAATGDLGLKVLSNVSKLMIPGKYYMELNVRYSDGSLPDDNLYDVIESKQYVFSIKESLIFLQTPLP